MNRTRLPRVLMSSLLPMLLGLASEGGAKEHAHKERAVSLSVVLSGTVPSKCGVGGGADIALGELTGRDQASASFELTCNVPFDLVLTSAAGGIVHNEKPQGEGPYRGTIQYSLEVTVPGKSPGPVRLHGHFSSAEMVSGAVLSSGDAIAVGGGRIRLQGQLGPDQDLLAGRYRDSVTIVINPRV